MPVIDSLTKSDLSLKGATPPVMAGASPKSTLHYQSSINNIPVINRKPSSLDLDGKKPAAYMDNPPK